MEDVVVAFVVGAPTSGETCGWIANDVTDEGTKARVTAARASAAEHIDVTHDLIVVLYYL